MLEIIQENEKTKRDFPEMEDILLKIYQTEIEDGKRCIIVEEPSAHWPSSIDGWSQGEINRLDFGKQGRLYELPYNQGNFGSRVEIIRELISESTLDEERIIRADLGHRNGYFNYNKEERVIADLRGLDSLGYSILLPFEYELSFNPNKLKALLDRHDEMTLLATNVKADSSGLFHSTKTVIFDSIRIGFLGMIDPGLQSRLSYKIARLYQFDNIIDAAQKGVEELYDQNVDVIIALSNMTSEDNAIIAERVGGIDLIVADLSSNGVPNGVQKQISIPKDRKVGLGHPLHIAKTYDYGAAVGKLDVLMVEESKGKNILSHISEKNYQVSDQINENVEIISSITSDLNKIETKKGDLLFPAFVDLAEKRPKLSEFDEVTKNGRVSKELWQKFLANLLRKRAPAEVSFIHPVNDFSPLIGKLHEREVREWLRMEEDLVLMDLKGRDLKRLSEADLNNELITSGLTDINVPVGKFYFVMGKFLEDDTYYRVATTNSIINGKFKENFRWGYRKSTEFSIDEVAGLKPTKSGTSVTLRDFTLTELKRIRALGKSDTHHENIADIISPKSRFENLVRFKFDRPTLWSSLNRNFKGDGYESVPESRIVSANSFVVGVQGGFILSLEKLKYKLDLGTRFAFAQQSADVGAESYQRTETMDDAKFSLTYQFRGKNRHNFNPFVRMIYDTEFTATFNSLLELKNPRQKIFRNVTGVGKRFGPKIPLLEVGVTLENDFTSNHYQYGLQARNVMRLPLDKQWHLLYMVTNNINYNFPTAQDTERELAYKINTLHELLVPLHGDISLSVGADFFFYKGKTEINSDPGTNILLRLGFTYNRVWKPKFQSFF